jgi:hypothetical protein
MNICPDQMDASSLAPLQLSDDHLHTAQVDARPAQGNVLASHALRSIDVESTELCKLPDQH